MKKNITRRDFLTLGCISAAASGLWWTGSSNRFAARFIRDRFGETGRSISTPPQTPTPSTWDPNSITLSWLGHSTVLINFFGFTVLTDPVLFSRVGANLGFATVGPKRLVAPALTTAQLPKIDLVLLSHAHMDHLDLPTLKAIPTPAHVVTAHATADLFGGTSLPAASELRWGQSQRIRSKNGTLDITAFEVNHWGARWRRDTYRGYNGYVLEREGRKILFGGDTAFCSAFSHLRSKGPFDIALMPIGAYAPWTCSHCTPEQAVWMANAARSRYLVPIHHRTFRLGKEGPIQPFERFKIALEQEPDRIAVSQIGQTFSLT